MKLSDDSIDEITKIFPSGSGLLIFDGECALCNALIGHLLKIDKNKKLFFATFHSPVISDRLSDDNSAKPPASLLFLTGGKIFTESAAVLEIARVAGIYPIITRIGKTFPDSLLNFAYRLIARHRYRIFGRAEHCIVPSAEDTFRFY